MTESEAELPDSLLDTKAARDAFENQRVFHVLSICSFPLEAAATRFRLAQFARPLKSRGLELTISPFLNSSQFKKLYGAGRLFEKALRMIGGMANRLTEIWTAGRYDVLLVQREAMIFGPGVFEWAYSFIGRLPMVLDLDDPTYVHYVSPTYGKLGSKLKFFGKTDILIKRARVVICGNRFIAEYVESKGTETVVVPTVVDLDEFKPREEPRCRGEALNVGWIGTHSTFPFLESIFPVLQRLAADHRFVLKIVGAGKPDIELKGVELENLDWSLDREIEDFQSLDLGLYPIFPRGAANNLWIKGKSGFKAIQYMAVGVPFVMSPVGVCAEIGEPGRTHFNANTEEDWYTALNTLLTDKELRTAMGRAAREHSLSNYGIEQQADRLADVLRSVVGK